MKMFVFLGFSLFLLFFLSFIYMRTYFLDAHAVWFLEKWKESHVIEVFGIGLSLLDKMPWSFS